MKTALITGATSGIGLAFAELLAQQGYGLILHGRNVRKLSELSASLPNVQLTLAADLSCSDEVTVMIEQLEQVKQPIDVAINNAGFGLYGKHTELKESDIAAMLALNVSALTRLSRYFAERMAVQGSGHILNVASTAGYQPQPYFAAYAATKAYVASFTEAMALEMKSSGVSMTCLSPGRTDTGFFTFEGKDDAKSGTGTFSAKHRAHPQEIARLGLKAMFAEKLREIPLFENKFYVFLNRLLPRTTMLSIYERAMKNI
ncbi:SDR family oxidoreductase [Photobacterium sp. MCCC 1A19761]|uniref:SDR family NAD(P)-dependent oxidoreductase n=1 Tax=Photobacterium sp. MCCC 1A19761 TaxID=3115000 RepID=UPI00307EEF35